MNSDLMPRNINSRLDLMIENRKLNKFIRCVPGHKTFKQKFRPFNSSEFNVLSPASHVTMAEPLLSLWLAM